MLEVFAIEYPFVAGTMLSWTKRREDNPTHPWGYAEIGRFNTIQ